MDILNSIINSSSDNYRKSSEESLGIGFCPYIAITFHNNLTRSENYERINNLSSVTQYPACQLLN